jgi:hypothetical protein
MHREASDISQTIIHQLDRIKKVNLSGHNSEAKRYIIHSKRYTKAPYRLSPSPQKATNTKQKEKPQKPKQIGIGIGPNQAEKQRH